MLYMYLVFLVRCGRDRSCDCFGGRDGRPEQKGEECFFKNNLAIPCYLLSPSHFGEPIAYESSDDGKEDDDKGFPHGNERGDCMRSSIKFLFSLNTCH